MLSHKEKGEEKHYLLKSSTRPYLFIYIYMYISLRVRLQGRACCDFLWVFKDTPATKSVSIYIYIYIHIFYVYIYVHTYTYYMSVYIYIYTSHPPDATLSTCFQVPLFGFRFVGTVLEDPITKSMYSGPGEASRSFAMVDT